MLNKNYFLKSNKVSLVKKTKDSSLNLIYKILKHESMLKKK